MLEKSQEVSVIEVSIQLIDYCCHPINCFNPMNSAFYTTPVEIWDPFTFERSSSVKSLSLLTLWTAWRADSRLAIERETALNCVVVIKFSGLTINGAEFLFWFNRFSIVFRCFCTKSYTLSDLFPISSTSWLFSLNSLNINSWSFYSSNIFFIFNCKFLSTPTKFWTSFSKLSLIFSSSGYIACLTISPTLFSDSFFSFLMIA